MRRVAVCLALMTLGCGSSTAFECEGPEQCAANGQSGFCEDNGWCSFPDESCDSGRRYGALAGEGLAGTCVALGGSTGVTPTSGTTTGGPGSSGPVLDDSGSTTTAPTTNGDSSTGRPDPTTTTSTTESDTDEPGEVLRNYVFQTSAQLTGAQIGGLAGADAICQMHAEAAGLPGTYAAWLSTQNENAVDRVAGATGGWARTDGRVFAHSLADLLALDAHYPIRLNEFGEDQGALNPNTATADDGTFVGPGDCDGWTSTAGNAYRGHGDALADRWTFGFTQECSTPRPIYCFGIDDAAEIPVQDDPPGRVAFVTAGGVAGTEGRGAFDALCGVEAANAGLPGDFVAFVAISGEAATDRLDLTGPGWVNTGGQTVVLDPMDLVTSGTLVAPVFRLADGSPDIGGGFWTGSSDPSTPGTMASTCADFSDDTSTAMTGRRDRTITWWDNVAVECTLFRRVMCFEQ